MAIEMTEEFKQALDLMERGENIFLTGKAGSGKSTLIREFLSTTNRVVEKVAPTGIAALNIDGFTIHKFFGLRPTTTLKSLVEGKEFIPHNSRAAIEKIDTLIIDEASMLRADLFDIIVWSLKKYGKNKFAQFGGVQLILVGDLFQLPPVVTSKENHFFTTYYDTPYFFSANNYTEDTFSTIELTKVFRQTGDDTFVNILNAIREGYLDDEMLETLNKRYNPDFTLPPGEMWVTLAATNRVANERNAEELARINSQEFTSTAAITGNTKGFTYPTEEVLKYKVGSQIMMINNAVSGAWVNGTIATITNVDSTIPHAPMISARTEDGRIISFSYNTWEITSPKAGKHGLDYDVIGSFTQLPFKLAWAITIHKSQGQTLNNAIIDLTGGTYATGQLYVALSRCTSLTGMVLKKPIQKRDLKVDDRVQEFMKNVTNMDTMYDKIIIECVYIKNDDDLLCPIEIALVNNGGGKVSTLIHPGFEIGDKGKDYNITDDDLILAPEFSEAWEVIEPLLKGKIVYTSEPEELYELVDDEIEVCQVSYELDNMNLIPRDFENMTYVSALEKAESTYNDMRTAYPWKKPKKKKAVGFLLNRDGGLELYGNEKRAARRVRALYDEDDISENNKKILRQAENKYKVDLS